jgi:hypothetical protein
VLSASGNPWFPTTKDILSSLGLQLAVAIFFFSTSLHLLTVTTKMHREPEAKPPPEEDFIMKNRYKKRTRL